MSLQTTSTSGFSFVMSNNKQAMRIFQLNNQDFGAFNDNRNGLKSESVLSKKIRSLVPCMK